MESRKVQVSEVFCSWGTFDQTSELCFVSPCSYVNLQYILPSFMCVCVSFYAQSWRMQPKNPIRRQKMEQQNGFVYGNKSQYHTDFICLFQLNWLVVWKIRFRWKIIPINCEQKQQQQKTYSHRFRHPWNKIISKCSHFVFMFFFIFIFLSHLKQILQSQRIKHVVYTIYPVHPVRCSL